MFTPKLRHIIYMIERNPSDPRYKIDYSKKVFVYKNLHKDCWSIKQDGLVKAHTEEVRMWDCAFQVNAKGRAKVLEEKRKNVHAGIKGYLDDFHGVDPADLGKEVTYNPYKYDSFVDNHRFDTLMVKYDTIWENKNKIEDYVNGVINLPEKENRDKKNNEHIRKLIVSDSEYKILNNTYESLIQKIKNSRDCWLIKKKL